MYPVWHFSYNSYKMKKFLLFLGILLLIAVAVGLYAWHLTGQRSDKFKRLQSEARQYVQDEKYAKARRSLTDSLDYVVKQEPTENKIDQISNFQTAINFLKVANYSDAITSFQSVLKYQKAYAILSSRSNQGIKTAQAAIDKQKAETAAANSAESQRAQQADAAAKSSSAAAAVSSVASEWTEAYKTSASVPQNVVVQARKNLQQAGIKVDSLTDDDIRNMIVAAGKVPENIVTYAKQHGNK